MTKKRILLLGDAAQVHLIRWEAYLRENGYDMLTLSLEPTDGIAGPHRRLHVASLWPDLLRYPMAVPAVRRMARDFQPDLVNAHFLPNYGVIADIAGFRPWVLSTWGSDVMVLPHRTPFHMLRTRRVIRRASAITADARVMTERLVELGAPRDRITTFPMGVDRRAFHPARDVGRGDSLRILSNRKLEDVYDVASVVAAIPRVLQSEPRAVLTIAGEGRRAGSLHASASGLPAAIRFIGNVTHAAMPELLRQNHIYVSMALSDTTSVSLLEAMACGVFPVVGDLPANREWIEHGRNGFVVPLRDAARLGDAMVEAWRNPDLRKSAAEYNARIIADRADWHENMSVLRRLFDRLIGQAKA
jgi:glycosyltransferase involved in cell wall biosynthesis